MPNLRLVALAAVLASACAPSEAAVDPVEPRLVRIAEVGPAPDGVPVRLFGVTRAADRASLAFTAGGRLIERSVEPGERVAAGTVVARLDRAPLRNARDAARGQAADLDARLSQARRDLDRVESLFETRGVSAQDVEQARSGVTSLESSLAAARAREAEAGRQLSEGVLVAPFDGVVVAVGAEAGETVGAGQPVVVLQGEGAVEVQLEVPESVLPGVEVGARATVDLPALGHRGLDATVRTASGAAAPGGLFPVLVDVAPHPALRPGLTAEVELSLPVRDAVVSVPLGAVVDPTGQAASVYRVRDGVASRVRVEPTTLVGDAVAVVGPLDTGDAVVVAGQVGLVDGDAVEVVP